MDAEMFAPLPEAPRTTTASAKPAAEWLPELPAPDLDLMNAADTVTHILLSQRHRLTEVQLRQWVKRGYVTTRGRDDAGRSLYDPIEVAAVVIQRRARTA